MNFLTSIYWVFIATGVTILALFIITWIAYIVTRGESNIVNYAFELIVNITAGYFITALIVALAVFLIAVLLSLKVLCC